MASGSISSGSSGAAYSGGGGGGLSSGSSGAAYSGGGWAGGGYGSAARGMGGMSGGGRSYEDLLRLLYPERYAMDQSAQDPFAKYENAFQSLGGINAYKAPPGLEIAPAAPVTTPYGTISTTNPAGQALLEQAINPQAGGRVNAADAYRANPTPEGLDAYKQAIRQQNVQRFGWSPGVEGLEPVAQSNAAQRKANQAARYKNHLLNNFIDPESIGGSKLYTDAAGNRRMEIPSLKQQEEAHKLAERSATKINKIRKAAMNARAKGRDTEALSLEDEANRRSQQVGGEYGKIQDKYKYFLDSIMGWG